MVKQPRKHRMAESPETNALWNLIRNHRLATAAILGLLALGGVKALSSKSETTQADTKPTRPPITRQVDQFSRIPIPTGKVDGKIPRLLGAEGIGVLPNEGPDPDESEHIKMREDFDNFISMLQAWAEKEPENWYLNFLNKVFAGTDDDNYDGYAGSNDFDEYLPIFAKVIREKGFPAYEEGNVETFIDAIRQMRFIYGESSESTGRITALKKLSNENAITADERNQILADVYDEYPNDEEGRRKAILDIEFKLEKRHKIDKGLGRLYEYTQPDSELGGIALLDADEYAAWTEMPQDTSDQIKAKLAEMERLEELVDDEMNKLL